MAAAPDRRRSGAQTPPSKAEKPAKRATSASMRRPVTDLDLRITAEVERLRTTRWPDRSVSKADLAVAAGYTRHHALRLLRAAGPKQSWSINEVADYAGALGVSAGTILAAAGIEPVSMTLEERILGDDSLAPSDRGVLVGLVQTMRRAAR